MKILPTEEEFISMNFDKCFNNDQLSAIPILILDRIIKKYMMKNDFNTNNLLSFWFKCLDKQKKNAFILLENIKSDQLPIDIYQKLFNEYQDCFDFDVIHVNSIFKIMFSLLDDFNKSEIESSKKIDDINHNLNSQKTQINELKGIINEQKELINSLTKTILTQNDKINSLSAMINSQKDQLSNEFITKSQIKYALEQGRSYADNEQRRNHQNWENEGKKWPDAEHWATWGKAYIASATSLQRVKDSIPS